jgi:uncharacterized protein
MWRLDLVIFSTSWRGLAAVLLLVGTSHAQIPPNPAEITAYHGLHAAAAKGDLATLHAALRGKPDLDDRDGHGRTPVHVAAHFKQREIMRELARAGADMRAKDSQAYDAITIAAVNGDAETVKLAISLGSDPRAITSPYNGTALIAAAHLGYAEVVRALIAAGAPLDHVNNLGWTAVMEAVVLGDGGKRHQDTLKALVDAGANIHIPDRQGVTPLEHAKRRGFSEMVTMLSR